MVLKYVDISDFVASTRGTIATLLSIDGKTTYASCIVDGYITFNIAPHAYDMLAGANIRREDSTIGSDIVFSDIYCSS